MCVCACVHMCSCVYACVYVYACARVCVCTSVYVCMNMCEYTCVCKCVCECVCMVVGTVKTKTTSTLPHGKGRPASEDAETKVVSWKGQQKDLNTEG
jgi:hypothetical protein